MDAGEASGGGRGGGGRWGGRRTGSGRLAAAERLRRAALAEARGEAALPPADAPEEAVVAVQPQHLAVALPALHVPREVLADLNSWRASCVPCPPLAGIVAKFASAATEADVSALAVGADKCIRSFWDARDNSIHTTSFAARASATGVDRKLVQKLERRMSSAAELRERGNSANLQAFMHAKHPTHFCCTKGADWLPWVMFLLCD